MIKRSNGKYIFFFLGALVLLIGVPSHQHVIASPNTYVYPILAPKVSSNYGKRRHPIRRITRHHSGIDLAAPKNAPIRAIADGTVIFSDPFNGYGKMVVVRHANGLSSHYGHCNSLKVTIGQKIKAGQIIATVGSTGLSTGPHLHLEIRKHGEPLNPLDVLPGLKSRPQG